MKFYTDEDYDDAIRRKIIESLDEICFNYFFQEFVNTSSTLQDKDYYVIVPTTQENLCLSIFNEFIRIYKDKYSRDIFRTVKFALEKR